LEEEKEEEEEEEGRKSGRVEEWKSGSLC